MPLLYRKQTVCVKWGRCISEYFSTSNGVRQGGILSPKLFYVYVDDLSDRLVKSKVGCSFDNLCMNHEMYRLMIFVLWLRVLQFYRN